MSEVIIGLNSFLARLERLEATDLVEPTKKAISLVQEKAKTNVIVHNGELRNSIYTDIEQNEDSVIGTCYTNKAYAPFIEFGTGPKGQANHKDISPDVAVTYTQSPWWIHESQLDEGVAERYHWECIETKQGKFYKCTGQPARPFMYPALKDNKDNISDIYKKHFERILGKSK